MFIALSSQAEDWSYVIKDNVAHDFKLKLNQYLVAAKSLRTYCEKFVSYDALGDDSELFSQILGYVKNAKTAQDKKLILELLHDFVNGRVAYVDDPVEPPTFLSGHEMDASTKA